MNRVELIGRLTRDAEIRYVGDGRYPIIGLNLAVDDGEGRWNRDSKKTELGSGFYKIEQGGDAAAALQPTMRKGDRIYVLGSLSQYTFAGKDGGEKQTKTSVKAQVLLNLSQVGAVPIDEAMSAPEGAISEEQNWDEEPF